MNFQQYNDNAGCTRTRDITTNSNNRIVLRRIKRNSKYDENNNTLYIQNQHDDEGEDCIDYVPESAYDMGWLGYFIGKNKNLTNLYLSPFTPSSSGSFEEVLTPFLIGVNNNRSITSLDFCRGLDLLGGKIFTIMGPFFENSPVLAELHINECNLGDNGWRLLALAIGSSKAKSLQKVTLVDCNVSDEGLVDIITALSIHPHLQNLWWSGNRLSTKGCMALATLLRYSCTIVKTLHLDNNELDDEGIHALVPVLKNCSHLHTLMLNDNLAISLKGWRCLATILEAPSSNLTDFFIMGNNIDDEVVNAFTSALLNNHTLRNIFLHYNETITDKRWKAFSKLLCDTSSVNSTYLSNHTLTFVTGGDTRASLKALLYLNKRENKKEVAMIKILQNHNDINLTPFFEWEFKVLPLMIGWLGKASAIDMPEDYEPNIGPRKLSSIYQFVRGMPLEYVDTHLRKELEDIKSKESKMEEKQQELEEELLELEAEHQLIQEKKAIIMKQLSR